MITNFEGQYRFLSNFYPSPLEYEGEEYQTVEHAFQAAKTHDPVMREAIRGAATPGRAKQLGRVAELRQDWDGVRLTVMEEILSIKFSDPKLKEALLATGKQTLIEGNTWKDKYWGAEWEAGEWVGENHLGKILMALRAQLAADGGTDAVEATAESKTKRRSRKDQEV